MGHQDHDHDHVVQRDHDNSTCMKYVDGLTLELEIIFEEQN